MALHWLPIRAMSSPSLFEPGVFGVFRPVLLLPQGIFDRLTPAQLKAVIAHELCHVRHRDNLIAAIHMFVETRFGFILWCGGSASGWWRSASEPATKRFCGSAANRGFMQKGFSTFASFTWNRRWCA